MSRNWLPVFLFLGTIGCVIPATFGIVGLSTIHGDAALPVICIFVVCNIIGFFGCGVIFGSISK